MKTLYIVRGLPGSGKTSFVKNLMNLCVNGSASAEHFEADQYFYLKDGKYTFEPSLIGAAHFNCRHNTKNAMLNNVENIFVSNTFTTEKEMKPYFQLATEFDYKVVSLVVENRHGNSSVHGVPEDTLVKMKDRFSLKL